MTRMGTLAVDSFVQTAGLLCYYLLLAERVAKEPLLFIPNSFFCAVLLDNCE